MDKRIDYELVSTLVNLSYECGNCRHDEDGLAGDFCDRCNMDYRPPGNYRPKKNTIYEKIYYDNYDRIRYAEYIAFLDS